jgi:hypothetical protein
MATGIDRRSGVFGMEPWHVHNGHGFDTAVQETFMSRKTGESPFLLDAQAIADLLRRRAEVIRHGVNVVAAVSLEEFGQPRPAPAATDKAELDPAWELRELRFARESIGRE